MAFKTSINIKFDIGNNEFINRYIPTPSHAEAMKGILEGFTEENANRSHIIVGPYGTGKSLLANVIGSVVSKMVGQSEINVLTKKIDQVDDYIAEKINIASNLSEVYLPILLSGNEGRFRQSILSNVIKKLKDHDVDVILPGLSNKIIESINVWKSEFQETYVSFVNKLELDGKDIILWIEEIKKQNQLEIKYFSNIYPLLTSGASFDIDYDHSFMSQMEFLVGLLEERNLGIFIIYDEFARFLQGLSISNFNEAMQDIQDLAELSNRSKSIHFLLITHKSLRQYFNTSIEEASTEFQRIEKRFRQYLVKSDQATFLRIAEIIVSENITKKPEISLEEFSHIQGVMRKFPLFPSINQTERDEIVIRGMYPLHPVSLFLLPHLTRVFGQNERTLFTFLESQETGGLFNHISKSNNYYLTHQLFDFFFPDTTDYGSDEIAEHILLYKKAIARMPEEIKNKQVALNLIKVIALWNLCAVQNEQKLTTEFLLFATQINKNELTELFSLLSLNKLIRFNRVNEFWELFAGNSIDLQEKLDQEKQSTNSSITEKFEVLYKNLSKKFYFPEEYNDEKGMTRFATIKFIYETDVMAEDLGQDKKFSDLSIYYVLPRDYTNPKVLESKLTELSKERSNIFYLHPHSIETITNEINNYLALDSLRKNKLLLAEDKGIKEELEIMINETKYTLSSYLSEISNFSDGNRWYSDGQKVNISTELELTKILTEKCYELYNKTPIVLNDSFNRGSISGAQRNAAIQLIDQIIAEPTNNQFGIMGNGPEYALYAAIFKNNNGFDINVNNQDYTNIQTESFSLLRLHLIDKLENDTTGNFQDIINIFIDPPFGIRKPLIPILLVALLRDRWNEFMLYRNDMFVPGINGTKLIDIIVEVGSENYQYVYEKIDQNHINFYKKIEVEFKDYLEDRLNNQSRLIYICGTLLKWLRSLPRITQASDNVEEEFRWIRECIRRSEIDPQQSIIQIYERYYNNIEGLLLIKQYAEEYLSKVKSDISNKVLSILDMGNQEELKNWAIEQHEKFQYDNKLIDKLNSSIVKNESQDGINQFIESYIGVRVDDWSDTTYDLFINQLNYDYEQINKSVDEEVMQTNDNVVTIQLNNSKKRINIVDLSVKSTTVYANLERMINAAGKNVPRQELECLIYKLFENYVVKLE
ncbi:hypothetical protein [Paenibacillus sp. LPE1-1-1.1]|uniref:hypothetical protein n=1 Tax=Paenibacillus sp. LPE1-1-1.1 TaxID=3135230 RepID=UPI00341577A3